MSATGSRYRKLIGLAVFLLVLALPALLHAQFDAGVIVGKVTDPLGAPVHNAVVTLRNVDLGTSEERKTTEQGDYEFTSLQIGYYVVSVESPGFDTSITDPVEVTVDSRPRVDIKMKVGQVSENVTVDAASAQLQTDSSDRGLIIEQREIQDLPLNGREYTDLATLAPGVQVSSIQDGSITQRRGSFNVNGNRSSVNNFLLDGLDNNSYQPANQGFNNEAITESVDAIAQFKVQTSNFSAEYGRAGGAIVNVTTNSGTNQFHGRVWDYFRNTVLDAFGPFYGPAGIKPTLIQNQFGIAMGGPIRRDSIFWFADYEGFRAITTTYQSSTLPTMDQRAGNFHDQNGIAVGLKNPYTGVPHTNGQIPSTDITAFASAVLALLPPPTNTGYTSNYISLPRNQNGRDIGDVRIDWHPNARLQNFLRYTQQSDHIFEGPHIPGMAGGDGNGHTRILATQVATGATFTVSPNSILDARMAFTWNETGKVPVNQGQPSINGLYQPLVSTNPYLAVSLNTQTVRDMSYFGEQDTDPQYSNPYTANYKINYTLVHDKHSFSMGYEYLALSEDEDSASSKTGEDTYEGNFSADAVSGTAPSSTARNEAYGVADFMYGARSEYQLSNFNPKTVHNSFHYVYFEDTWRAASRLTLNLGLRYEFQIPQTVDGNQQSNYDPGTNTLIQARNGSIYSRTLVNPQKTNFAPRLGLAFTSDPKTVWHAAYGITYIQFNRSSSDGNISLNGPSTIVSDISQTIGEPICPTNNTNPNSCFSPTMQGYPLSVITPAFFSTSTSTVRYMPKDGPTAYVQSYYFGIQEQFSKSTILNIDYVGQHAVRLRVLGDLNQAAVQPTSTSTLSLNQRRPIAGFQGIVDNLSAGFLRYNSLQVQIQTRTKQFFILNSFTWSRAIDNAVADLEANYGDSTYVNMYNVKGDSGTSGYNQPLNDTFAGYWNIPYGSKKEHGLLQIALGNWQLTSIAKLTSGVPINFSYDPSTAAETTTLPYAFRPNLTGPHYTVMNPRSAWVKTNTAVLNVFNGAQLGAPSQTVVYGNAPRNFLRGTPYYDLDLGVHKKFALPYNLKFEFRVEAFNVLNHTSWKAATSDISSSTFGQLGPSNAYPSRIIQLAAKIIW